MFVEMAEDSILTFLCYVSMTLVGIVAHVSVMKKFLFLLINKLYIACGLLGMYNTVFQEGAHNHALSALFFYELISEISFVTTEICLTNGIHWGLAVVTLCPVSFDFLSRMLNRPGDPVSRITNYLDLGIITIVAFCSEQANLYVMSAMYFLALFWDIESCEGRFFKSVAMYTAIDYFAEVESMEFAGNTEYQP